jgi:hypothetical protein
MPGGKILPVAGDTVIFCSYWLRRLTAGDIEEFKPDADEPPVAELVAEVEETRQISEPVADATSADVIEEVTHAG